MKVTLDVKLQMCKKKIDKEIALFHFHDYLKVLRISKNLIKPLMLELKY
jgi:hypothetical protein